MQLDLFEDSRKHHDLPTRRQLLEQLEQTGQQAAQISQHAKLRALAPDLFADFMRSR
jgi:hypothetical protein